MTDDILDSLNNPQVRGSTSDYFGQVTVDYFYCVLVKGTGKVTFDPSKHNVDQRRTSIKISMIPLAEMNISYDISRDMLAESREFAGIVLPSIKTLNVAVQEINNKWVHIQIVETGNTYVDRNGQTRNKTTFKFVELFADEKACRAAYQAISSSATPSGNGASKEKETAAKFLKPIVANACMGKNGDLTAINQTLAAALANMPQIAKYFTVDSPEVMTLVMETINGH